MEIEKLEIPAERQKAAKELLALFGDLGFNRIELTHDDLLLEKSSSDLHGKDVLDYRITFSKKKITLEYWIPPTLKRKKRFMEIFPVFLHALRIAGEGYFIDGVSLYTPLLNFLDEIMAGMDRNTIELAADLDELKRKYAGLQKRYDELIRSSEENARILIECERKRNELYNRVKKLEGTSDDILRQEVFEWIKSHGGKIDIIEFSKQHSIPVGRTEEILDGLLREEFIRRKNI